MVSLLTNVGAAQARQALGAIDAEAFRLRARISTGLKVAGPKDDGATYAIAQGMRSEVSGWGVVRDSLNRTRSTLDVAIAAGEGISDTLSEVRSKAIAYGDASLDAASRAALLTDIKALVARSDSAARNASFAGVNLLDIKPNAITDMTPAAGAPQASINLPVTLPGEGGNLLMVLTVPPSLSQATVTATPDDGSPNSTTFLFPSTTSSKTVTLGWTYGFQDETTYAGPGGVNLAMTVNPKAAPALQGFIINSLTFTPFRGMETSLSSPSGGVDGVKVSHRPLTSDWLGLTGLDFMSADTLLTTVDAALAQVNGAVSKFGSEAAMVDRRIAHADKLADTLQAGVGNIVDTDLAKDSAKLQAIQVRQDLATRSLAIAGQQASWMVGLFRAA